MASAVTSQKLFANAILALYDHDPGGTSATIVSPDGGTTKRVVALENFDGFAVVAMTSVSASTSGVQTVEIVGCTDSSGSNPTVVTTVSADGDAVGDYIVTECTASQVKEVGDAAGLTLTHVAGRITCDNAGDEAVVLYVRHMPRYPQLNLTANVIS